MERLMKVMCLVLVATLISPVASALTYYYGAAGDWTDTAFPGMSSPPVAASGDQVYMYYDTPASPLVITAGTNAEADFLHFDYNGGLNNALVVNGSLDTTAGASWNNIIFGSWYQGVGLAGIITINDGGSVTTGQIGVYNYDYDPINSYGTDTGDYDVVLNGGTLTAGSLRYSADLGFFITINIADYDAALICPQADYDAVNALAVGGVVGADTIVMEDLGGGMGKYTLIPEPATLALLGLGALVIRRKK